MIVPWLVVLVLAFQQPVPSPATLPKPANGATGIALIPNALTWAPSLNAMYYRVQLAPAGHLNDAAPPEGASYGQPSVTAFGLIAPRQPIPNLPPLTRFEWRVDACNQTGCALGPVWTFTTRAAVVPVAVRRSRRR